MFHAIITDGATDATTRGAFLVENEVQ